MTSQQTFTGLKSTRETLEVVGVLMSLYLTLNIIHTIFESLFLTLNRKKFIWIASSDYETISIYIIFFQTIKRSCQVHVQATSFIALECFRKKQFFVTFRVCYMRNNLAWLGEYLTHLDVADMSNLFYFHFVFTWSRAMTRLPRSNSASLARRLCESLCTNLN